ncbi:Tho complex subunit 7 [Onchocerca flexuosa]|uniref:Tho complex subunit 7 n=1 Tax=Onchocerca flexuosa TaxID=387005 RepID=A0A238BND3_9BILA|nr:Tho complex subunit 7 [Onchocerca flexuosa]
MNEECIIRKLVADGDGGGDDRRFVTILTLLLKFIKEPEPSQSLLPRIMKMIDAAETAMKKQVLISAMNERQIQEYSMLTNHIGKANEKMSIAKKELSVAKGMRKNKEEYELLAKMIEKVSSRPETIRKLEIIKKELEELHEKQRNLETKLADRRNHLHAFNIILANFCRFLKDEENDEMNNDENLDGTTVDTKKEKA